LDVSIDKIKRLGALTSTGTNNRLDFEAYPINTKYTCAELKDIEVGSDMYEQLRDTFVNGAINDLYKTGVVTHKENELTENEKSLIQ